MCARAALDGPCSRRHASISRLSAKRAERAPSAKINKRFGTARSTLNWSVMCLQADTYSLVALLELTRGDA